MTGPKFHDFFVGSNYLECCSDIHRFCYAARSACAEYIPNLIKYVIDISLVVQGNKTSELPEQLIGRTLITLI